MSAKVQQGKTTGAKDWLNDPYFVSFATMMAKILAAANPRLKLLERSLRPYADPVRHPLAKLARRAARNNSPVSYREKITEVLHREAKTPAQKAGITAALAVFDAALERDSRQLRQAVAQAGQHQREQ